MVVQKSAFGLSVEVALENVQVSLRSVANAADNSDGTVNMSVRKRLRNWLKVFEQKPADSLLPTNVADVCDSGVVAIRALATELEADDPAVRGFVRQKACMAVMHLDRVREQYFRSTQRA